MAITSLVFQRLLRYHEMQATINLSAALRSQEFLPMGKPKKRTSPRRTGTRRSHLVVKLARAVNAKSPVKAYTTRRESGKNA